MQYVTVAEFEKMVGRGARASLLIYVNGRDVRFRAGFDADDCEFSCEMLSGGDRCLMRGDCEDPFDVVLAQSRGRSSNRFAVEIRHAHDAGQIVGFICSPLDPKQGRGWAVESRVEPDYADRARSTGHQSSCNGAWLIVKEAHRLFDLSLRPR